MRSILPGRSIFFAILLALASAPLPGALPAAAHAVSPPDPLAGLDCRPARLGFARECSNRDHDVTGIAEACGEDSAAFGAVMGPDPVVAQNRLGEDARPSALLPPEQLVCMYYVADARSPDREGRTG